MLEGDLASINGRDRTEAFNDCMKTELPRHHGLRRGHRTGTARRRRAEARRPASTARPGRQGRLHAVQLRARPARCRCSSRRACWSPPTDPKHVFVVSNDGIPEELKDIGAGQIDATVSQPADLYAKYGLFYVKAAIDGKTFQPGPTDHDSTIIQVRAGPARGPARRAAGHRGRRHLSAACQRSRATTRRCGATTSAERASTRRRHGSTTAPAATAAAPVVEATRHHQALRLDGRAATTPASPSSRGRRTRWSAATAPASRRWSSILTGLQAPDAGAVAFDGEPAPRAGRPRRLAAPGRLRLPEVDDHPRR